MFYTKGKKLFRDSIESIRFFLLSGKKGIKVGTAIGLILLFIVFLHYGQHMVVTLLIETRDTPIGLLFSIVSAASLIGVSMLVLGTLWSGLIQPWFMMTTVFYRYGWPAILVPILGLLGVPLVLWGGYGILQMENMQWRIFMIFALVAGLGMVGLSISLLSSTMKRGKAPESVAEWGQLMESSISSNRDLEPAHPGAELDCPTLIEAEPESEK